MSPSKSLYEKNIFKKFDIQNNGLLSSLPYISEFVFVNLSSQLHDYLISRNIMKKLSIRKMFTAIGLKFILKLIK